MTPARGFFVVETRRPAARYAAMAKPPLGLARKLRDDVKAITGGRDAWWVSVRELELRHPDRKPEAIAAAVALAIEKGWLHGQPGPEPTDCVAYKHAGSFGV